MVSYIEIMRGARDAREQQTLRDFFGKLGIATIPLSENIGHRASVLIDEYALSSGLRLADALIAATAAETRSALCTGNRRHYAGIKDLQVEPFKA